MMLGANLKVGIMAAMVCMAVLAPRVAGAAESRVSVTGDSLVLVGTEPGKLMYAKAVPGTVVVRSTYEPGLDKTVVYEAGKDYTVDGEAGAIARTADSRIPDFATNMLYGQEAFDHTKFPGFGNGAFFVFVDYESEAAYPLCQPSNQAELLPKTAARLREGGPFKVIAYGDSITAGGDATTVPLRFQQRWVKYLAKQFPKAQLTLENGATGGDSTRQGLARLEEKILTREPDLVIIGFGMNDHNVHGVPLDQFKQNLSSIIEQIRGKTGAEVLLFSTFPPNPNWMHSSHSMEKYAAATQQVAEQMGCAFADVNAIWTKVLERKDLPSLLGNNINHPNDFGHWLYLQALEAVQF